MTCKVNWSYHHPILSDINTKNEIYHPMLMKNRYFSSLKHLLLYAR